MIKKIALFVILIGQFIQGQQQGSFDKPQLLESIPQEQVYVHTNSNMLFSGERILYKVYCLNAQAQELSSLSKIAYVTLIGEDQSTVFKHKITLNKGVGAGSFFVPNSVSTGSYKLLGYTQWMKNDGVTSFFQTDVQIINPYKETPKAYLKEIDTTQQLELTTSKSSSNISVPKGNIKERIKIKLDKNKVAKRSSVKLKFDGEENTFDGNYSLSIRKVDEIPIPPKTSFQDYYKSKLVKASFTKGIKVDNITYLPELRGELVKGKVVAKDGNRPISGKEISLSLPGEDYLIKIVRTDKDGNFTFNLSESYDNTSAIFQLIDYDEEYQIVLNSEEISTEAMDFKPFTIHEGYADYILDRSISNQIENAYVEVRKDSILPSIQNTPLYRIFPQVYNLDDYTRFNTIKETIVEIVDVVSLKKLSNGEEVFQVRPEEGFIYDNRLLPLVIVDGVHIENHNSILNFSAKKIQYISFSRDKILLGSKIFQGIVLLTTIDGNFDKQYYSANAQKIDLFKPESEKNFFVADYTDNGKERIPDYRFQLLWKPSFNLKDEKEVTLYTSDIGGLYEVVLEGYAKTGEPISATTKFEVK